MRMMNKGVAISAGNGTLVILSGACRSQARATIQVSGEKSSGREFIYANHVLKLGISPCAGLGPSAASSSISVS